MGVLTSVEKTLGRVPKHNERESRKRESRECRILESRKLELVAETARKVWG